MWKELAFMIPKEEELLDKLKSLGMLGFKAKRNKDVFNKDLPSDLQIDETSIETFFTFAKANEINTVFYRYKYYDPAIYLIDKDLLITYDKEENISLYEEKMAQYNKLVLEQDYNRPYSLTLLVLYNNKWVNFEIEECWISELGIMDDVEEAIKYVLQKDIDFDKINAENEKEAIENLWNYVYNDKTFQICTNQTMRKAYADNLEKLVPDLVEPLMNDRGFVSCLVARNFVELCWRFFKNDDTTVPYEVVINLK